MKYAKRITAAVTALAVSLALYATTYAESTGVASIDAQQEQIPVQSEITDKSSQKIPLDKDSIPAQLDIDRLKSQGFTSRLKSEEKGMCEIVLEKKDGTRALYLFDSPVKYVDENGDTVDKSNKAVRKDGVFKSESNDIDVTLPVALNSGIIFKDDELNITMRPMKTANIGRIMSVGAINNDDSVLYKDVFDEYTDIEYTYNYDGVQEDIILEKYNGKNTFDFEVTTGGLTLYEDKGTLLLSDESGEVKASLGEVVVFSADSKNNTFGDFEITEKVRDNSYIVTVSVDKEYLTSPDTAYPVRIDPTIKSTNTNDGIEDMQVFKGTDGSGSKETSSGNSGVSRVGWSDWGTCRTLIKFKKSNVLTNHQIGQSSQITGAYIELRDLMCQGNSVPVYCSQFTGKKWSETGSYTWNSINAESTGTSAGLLAVSYSSGKEKSGTNPSTDTLSHWFKWDVTKIVKGWVGNSANIEKGLIFNALPMLEGAATYAEYMKTFGSMQGNSKYKPYICIEYKYRMIYNAITELGTEDKAMATNTVSTFQNIGYDASFYDRPTINEVYTNANSGSILVFHGHGGKGYINVDQSQGGKISIYSENATHSLHRISDDAWSHISFVFFATCESGTADSSGGRNSMVDEAYELGADCVIGFKNEVSGAEDFINYMVHAIYKSPYPITIKEAVSIAKDNYSEYKKERYDCPANEDNLVVKGDQSIRLYVR